MTISARAIDRARVTRRRHVAQTDVELRTIPRAVRVEFEIDIANEHEHTETGLGLSARTRARKGKRERGRAYRTTTMVDERNDDDRNMTIDGMKRRKA